MSIGFNRRKFLAGSAAVAAASSLPIRASIAQSEPFRLGLLCVKTGPLAAGGIQMEQGVVVYLKEHDNTMGGRKVELFVADTGGSPAGAKTKSQELVERNKVDVVLGPLAAFELLAISEYMERQKTPMLSLAAAEDITQRRPNAYFVRASATSSQAMKPLADYGAKEMKLKKVMTVSEDFAFGHEQMGGFQQVFEDLGGQVVKKLWPPLVSPDYTPYLAQITDVDAVVQGFAGSNPVKFMKQYAEQGLKLPVLGGEAAGDDALMKSFSDEAIGLISACPYTADLQNEANQKFLAGMEKEYHVPGGFYAAGLYINCMVVAAALDKTGGKADDKDALVKALRSVSLADTPRGPIRFDHLGNVVGNVYIRKLEKKDGKLVNTTIKTYENIDQFWPYDEKKFLSQPVYSRDFPPLKS